MIKDNLTNADDVLHGTALEYLSVTHPAGAFLLLCNYNHV